jgi:acetylornithine/succinyldiaminopimelate/putrescine aminotransferase
MQAAAVEAPAPIESAPSDAHACVEPAVPGKQIVLDAMAEGLVLNCTHDAALRFLQPHIAAEKDVDAAMKILGKVFGKVK